MNVLVMASTIMMGGAKTIYNQFMSHLPEYIGSDKYLVYVSETLDKLHNGRELDKRRTM